MGKPQYWIDVRRLPDGEVVRLPGREAWAMEELLKVGDKGATPIANPGPRWSSYTHKLRRRGFVIETIDEMHGGPFAGNHARYVLHSQVEIIGRSADENRWAA